MRIAGENLYQISNLLKILPPWDSLMHERTEGVQNLLIGCIAGTSPSLHQTISKSQLDGEWHNSLSGHSLRGSERDQIIRPEHDAVTLEEVQSRIVVVRYGREFGQGSEGSFPGTGSRVSCSVALELKAVRQATSTATSAGVAYDIDLRDAATAGERFVLPYGSVGRILGP